MKRLLRRRKRFALLLVLVMGPVVVAASASAANTTSERSLPAITESKFELFVSDPIESAAFYEVLGFVVLHAKSYGYTTLRAGSTVIALSPIPWWLPVHWLGFLRYPPIGTEIVLYTDGLDETRAAFDLAGYAPGEISVQPWGDRDFRITDPNGYYIRVSEGVAVPIVQ
jgi:lactoylglutathione lyase